MTNKCTIISQIITLLHVSTLSCRLQGACNQYLAKFQMQLLVIQFTINPLAPELFFLISAQPVYKMWIIREPKKLALWNKLHFEEKKTEGIEHV